MKVNQAIIAAAGSGTRLGLGTKSLIEYKDKFLVWYLIKACIKAGITLIVVVIPTEEQLSSYDSRLVTKFRSMLDDYKDRVLFTPNNAKSFGRLPDSVRNKLDQNKPFYFLCGHSPQLPSHLLKMSEIYTPNSLVLVVINIDTKK